MTIPEQISGMPLAQFVDISARMVGLQTAEQCYDVVRQLGLEQSFWETANVGWTQELARNPDATKQHRALLIAALKKHSGVSAPITLDTYVDLNADFKTGTPPAVALKNRSHNMQSFSAASYEWMDRFEASPWLKCYFELRVHKAIAAKTGQADRNVGAVYGPGDLVRSRRCHSCGAVKVTKPSTAYVYCDYCATLFDYDPWIAVEDPSSLDPDMVDAHLNKVTNDQLNRAFKEGDRAEYSRIVCWTSSVLTEMCPAAYSPRIREPEYYVAFNRDLIGPWATVMRFDADHARESRSIAEAQRAAIASPQLSNILDLLSRSKKVWDLEASLLERAGLFAAHPDHLDRGRYGYINASTFVRPWLAVLSKPEQTQLLDAAGVRCEYIPLPNVEMTPRACGQCGQKLNIPSGSSRFVCEGCGFILDTKGRTFPCRQCGGSVSLPAGASEVLCGYCNARWTL